MPEFRYKPVQIFGKFDASPSSVSSGTQAHILTDKYGRLQMVGGTNDGASTAGVNPLLIAGVDSSGSISTLKTTDTGLEVNIVGSDIQVPVDVQSRYLAPTTLWSSTNTVDNGTATSEWIDLHTMEIKTAMIYCSLASTMIIEVTPTSSTATAYEYYRDSSVSASAFTSKTFTELFYYGRVKVVTPTASTLSGWFNTMP